MKIRTWLLVVLFGLIVLNLTHLFYLNIYSHSLRYGVYMRIQGEPQRGDFAATCLTPEIAQYGISRDYLTRGICGTGAVLVLKMIQGIPGDHFRVGNKFLKINGHSYHIMSQDSAGRPLKLFYQESEGVLDPGKYILLSDFAQNSWDSRYWGPVSIQFLLKPLWIFEP